MSHSKLPLIIKREYMTRVRKVSFIVMSLLMPVGMILLMALPTLIAMIGTTDTTCVAVIDRTARYAQSLTDAQAVTYSLLPPDSDEAALRSAYKDSGYDAYMVIDGCPSSRDSVRLYSENTLPMEVTTHTEDDLREALKREIMDSYAGNVPAIDSLFAKVNDAKAHITTINLSEDGSESENFAEVGMVVSILAAMLIYMFVLTTGSMVMQGVMEEKNNRIVEVLISSVRPFDLMMGKIIGIALVALTQLAIWIVCGVILMVAASAFFMPDADTIASMQQMSAMGDAAGVVAAQTAGNSDAAHILSLLQSINFPLLISLFIAYFIGGYLLYASLFAICGASIDSPSEGNTLSIIVMIPLFAAVYIAIHTMQDPSSALSFWASIFPFTSPIIMMARVPFGVSAWEVALSLAVLVATFILFTWIAARIYRIGILMYGKKVTLKELVKWFRQD